MIDKVFYYSGYKNSRVFLQLQQHESGYDDADDGGEELTEEDEVFPWYAWVHQSLKIPSEGKDTTTAAFGLHDFTCWLLITMCSTFI